MYEPIYLDKPRSLACNGKGNRGFRIERSFASDLREADFQPRILLLQQSLGIAARIVSRMVRALGPAERLEGRNNFLFMLISW